MRFVTSADGTRIAVHDHGNPSAPVLLCVHGYPDSARLWEPVVAELSGRFQVVAYDVRGAGESDHPTGRAAYRLERLEEDFAAVLDAVSLGSSGVGESAAAPVHLLAHDWGSIQSWHFLTGERLRGRIASYVSISGPCLDHLGYYRRTAGRRAAWRQVVHSWYVYLFQLPWLPEFGWRTGLWNGVFRRLQGGDGAVADRVSGVQLYRANVFRRVLRPQHRHTDVPVLVVAPSGDPFVTPAMQTSVSRWVSDLRIEHVDGGHWLPRTHPQLVARLAAAHVEDVAS